jgi:hypothetical protein
MGIIKTGTEKWEYIKTRPTRKSKHGNQHDQHSAEQKVDTEEQRRKGLIRNNKKQRTR